MLDLIDTDGDHKNIINVFVYLYVYFWYFWKLEYEMTALHLSESVSINVIMSILLAQFSVDGKHFRVTYEGECQDGDGIYCL